MLLVDDWKRHLTYQRNPYSSISVYLQDNSEHYEESIIETNNKNYFRTNQRCLCDNTFKTNHLGKEFSSQLTRTYNMTTKGSCKANMERCI